MMRSFLVGIILTVLLVTFCYAAILKTAPVVDLSTKFLLGKTFSDGIHPIAQRRDGSKIQLQFKSNAATQFIYSNALGRQTIFDLTQPTRLQQTFTTYSYSSCTFSVHNETPGKDCVMTTPMKWKGTFFGKTVEATICVSEDCDKYEEWGAALGG